MSVINKMSIVGIRSFEPEEKNQQMIEFFKPLTLILGPNGSGKTTIIECLRYMTTGDLPPNSDRGGSFVHDPKLAGEQEVKALVKLKLQDVLGKTVVVRRPLKVLQGPKKLSLKTLDGSITRYNDNDERIDVVKKCAEINADMITFLGVSKAILNNVIFCHQEESNWPLSEGKALKQRFDEIFAATRYIKALDEIRTLRLKKLDEVKKFETEVQALSDNKRKAEEFKEDLEKTETRLSACKDCVMQIENELKPVIVNIKEIKVKQNEIGSLQASLESNLDLIKKYEQDKTHLQCTIKALFEGSKEELLEEISNFNAQMSKKKKKLKKVQEESSAINRKVQVKIKIKAKLLEELGKLKAEHERHKNRMINRDRRLKNFRKKLEIGDLMINEYEMMDQSQVDNLLRILRQRNNTTQNELISCKLKHEENESTIQNNIERVQIEEAQKKQKLSSISEQIAKNKKAIHDINDELSQLDTLASRQDDIEGELKEAENDLNRLDRRVNVEECKEKLAAKHKRKEEIESQLSSLSHEINQLQKESEVRTKIDLINKDINSKQEAINKVLQRHKEIIVYLLNEMPENDFHEKISKLSNDLSNKIQLLTKNMEKEKSNLSSLETTKKFHEQELESKKKLLSEYQNKIVSLCGSQDLDYGIENLKSVIKELQNHKGLLTSRKYLFNNYIENLKKPRSCCPLCERSFSADEEAAALIKRLQSELQRVPSDLIEKMTLIAEKEECLSKMLELKPLKETVLTLAEREIPGLKSKLENVSTDISKTNTSLSEMEETLDNLSCDKKTAFNIIPDLIVLDQNQRELEKSKRQLCNLKILIGNKDTSRNIQQVTREQSDLHKELKSLSRDMDSIHQEVNDYREQFQHLRGRVNDLKAIKIKMYSDLQKKSSLLGQLDAMNKENAQLLVTVKEIKLDISNLKIKVKELNEEKANAIQIKEAELEIIRAKIKEEEKEAENIESLNKDINVYIRLNKEQTLIDHENQLNEITFEINSKSKEISNLAGKEKELSKEIDSHEILKRDLDDNLKLIEVIHKISQLNIKCQTLKNKIGGYNIHALLKELEVMEKKETDLIKEKGELVGRETEMKDAIRKLKKELQDNMFKDADKKYKDKQIELRVTQVACDDLSKYHTALNRAIMSHHKMRMSEINKIIKDLWRSTYAGNDIDYIEIQSDEDDGGGLEKAKRQYNYRVVMFKGDTPADMRGRCSAGQKVLASLIIRLALAETFCLNCGILALDEPTTNLDSENISNLACALIEIVKSRSEQRNFQLIIITHDAAFIDRLGRSQTVDFYYKVSKDANAFSKVSRCYISDMT